MPNPGWAVLVLFLASLAGGITREALSAEAQSSAPSPASGDQQPALNRVRALDYATVSGGMIVIRVLFRQPLSEPPTVFRSYHPTTRIVLGFADTTSELGKNPVEVGQRGLRSLEVVSAGTHTRLVINLAGPLAYESAVNGNELLITLQQRAR